MKRPIVFILIAFLIGLFNAPAFAQNWSIGPTAGVNFATISGDNSDDNGYKPGFIGGVVINYSNISHLGVSAKWLFAQYGAKNDTRNSELTLNYMQVPLYGVYYFGAMEDHFRPKIYAGPYVGFLLSAKDGDGVDANPNNEVFNGVDGGVVGGLGFNARIVRGIWLNADVRYSVGLADIVQSEAAKSYNQGLGIMVGVAFGLTPDEY